MAYNIPNEYKDKTPAPQLDQKTLNLMAWRSCFLQASFNYERMQACGWLYSILPGLRKIHTNKEDLSTSMSHNLDFFNTHPFLVTFVMGIIMSLEQNKADVPTIRAVRVAAMGPLGGIGDALFWFTLVPVTAGITANMALNKNIMAPILFLAIFNIFQFVIRFALMNWSYKLGTQAITIFTRNAKEFTRAASILGVFVVGSLTCLYGATSLNVHIPNGQTEIATKRTIVVEESKVSDVLKVTDRTFTEVEAGKLATTPDGYYTVALGNGFTEVNYNEISTAPVTIDIQKILDGIVPSLIPLIFTLVLYKLMTKQKGRKWTPLACICLLLVVALIGAGFGVFPSIWA